MAKPELVELLEGLHKGGSACAVKLTFDPTEKLWKRIADGGVEVFESAGRCCWPRGDRLWVFFHEASDRYEVLNIWWTPETAEAVIGNGVDDPTAQATA